MLLFVSFFNVLDEKGKLSAIALGAFEPQTIDSNELAYRNSYAQYLARDGVYEFTANGQGGVVEQDFEELAYVTTNDSALVAEFAPLVIGQSQETRNQIIYYVVQEGDTISEIAEKFGLSSNTVLWTNKLPSPDFIRVGEELEILPINGVKHRVQKGDTVSSLATKFKSEEGIIISYNGLPADGALRIGDEIIIPNGTTTTPIRAIQRSLALDTSSKYFIYPTAGKISQGYHGYNAVDIANSCGTAIYAAADGYVTSAMTTSSRAKYGASVFAGYGNHLKISHSNGAITLYAHMQNILVSRGQQVSKGEMIGTMGGGFEYVNGRVLRMQGAGKSSGCHLHFEVRGARNPVLSR